MMKRSLIWLLAAGMTLMLLVGCGGGMKNRVAVMYTEFGNVVLEFFPEDAPNHVNRFTELAKEGYYDGVLFHRVIPGFVVQAGDPKTKDPATPRMEYGTGGSGQDLLAEFNDRKHQRGTLAMARAQDPNSADSQFYIALDKLPHLDNKYTIFGQVVDGMEVIDQVAEVKTDVRDIPEEPVRIDSIRVMSRSEAGLE